MSEPGDQLKRLPAVSRLLAQGRARDLASRYGRSPLVAALRETLAELRTSIRNGTTVSTDPESILKRAAEQLAAPQPPSLRRVLNATGIIVHTHLGRAPLDPAAQEFLLTAAFDYTNLEIDLKTGHRGSRGGHVEPALVALTGAEAAMVVNNNAAAVLLAIATFAKDREVIVSRGELVEIGGSFRLPDILTEAGARLREVGTTNRTHDQDYETALGPETALILKVHPSNYRMVGFTKSVPEERLAAIAHGAGLPLLVDLGSGTTVDLRAFGLPGDAPVQETLRAGADLVMFSGDKLLGGPQTGIVLGKKGLVEKMRHHPFARALRVDKLTLALLARTVGYLKDPQQAVVRIPVLRMLTMSIEEMEARAGQLARLVRRALGKNFTVTVEEGVSRLGGGAWVLRDLPSRCVVIRSEQIAPHKIEEHLRAADPPVLARVHEDALWLDPRTLADGDLALVAAALPRDYH